MLIGNRMHACMYRRVLGKSEKRTLPLNEIHIISYFVVQSRNNMTLIKYFFVNGKRPYTKMFYLNKRF